MKTEQPKELTRQEVDRAAQKKVDKLKVAGKLPSFDQVNDVQDLVAEAHPKISRKTVAEAPGLHCMTPEQLKWRRNQN